jgi:hypothetical protein
MYRSIRLFEVDQHRFRLNDQNMVTYITRQHNYKYKLDTRLFLDDLVILINLEGELQRSVHVLSQADANGLSRSSGPHMYRSTDC